MTTSSSTGSTRASSSPADLMRTADHEPRDDLLVLDGGAEAEQVERVGTTWDAHWRGVDDNRLDMLYRRLARPSPWWRAPFTRSPRDEVAILGGALGTSPAGKRILELGSGIGWTSLELARQGAEVTLLDLSADALAASRRAFERAGQRGRWLQGSAFEPPASETGYDLVFNSGVIEHFHRPDQVRMVRAMAQCVRPGGHVVVLAPYAGGRLYRWAKRRMELAGTWRFGDEWPCWTLLDVMREAGLESITETTTKPGDQVNYLASVSRPASLLLRAAYLATGADLTPLWRVLLGDSLLCTYGTRSNF